MHDALHRQGVEFVYFGNHCTPPKTSFLGKMYDKYRLKAMKRLDRQVRQRKFAARVHQAIDQSKCDLIFAPVASGELYYLFEQGPLNVPVIYASDVTFHDLYKLYKPDLTTDQIATRQMHESAALSKSDKVVFPTSWAVESAVNDYNIASDKISVIPYGANIVHPPLIEDILPKLNSRRCRLLFIGVDWERKGGDIVVETFKILEDKGFDVELYILGSNPDLDIKSENLHIIPFLNKNLEADRQRFNQILLNSHFLVFPTKADTFGIVNCEANAYGIPVIASNAAGVPSVVRNGINGHTLPLSASGADYASVILNYLSAEGLNREAYEPLMLSARAEYDNRLNWDAWGKSMAQLMQDMVA